MRSGLPDRRVGGWRRGVVGMAMLATAGALLVSCDTPVGVSPALNGTYWEKALVTNPDGGGPQVVRWGPPQNYNPSEDNN
ncbi:MAG TPA: hypothetical protein VME47_10265 [Acetobacteraceae bacterium]|nr:hypothetical protein [Acetobacteraceae bacterium]